LKKNHRTLEDIVPSAEKEVDIIKTANFYKSLQNSAKIILGATLVGVIAELFAEFGLNIFYGYILLMVIGLILYFPVANYYRNKKYFR